MEWSLAIPIASVVISLGTLLFTGAALRQKAAQDELVRVQSRMTTVEHDLEECKRDRDELRLKLIELKADMVLKIAAATAPTIT